MPRKPKHSPIACKYFAWKLFDRDGVYYADGRGGKYDLGKHSLNTRDKEEALTNLWLLDQKKAIELGIAEPQNLSSGNGIPIADGWRLYVEHCGRSPVLGGVSPDSLKRYKAVRDHHQAFCGRQGITDWKEFDKPALEQYANRRTPKCAYRTLYLELTTIKTVNAWLIEGGHLSANAKLIYKLVKPQGTDTYCYSRPEVLAMVKLCMQTPGLNWLGTVIIALAHTGMRISELAALRWSDIDLSLTSIRVADERASRRKQKAGTARKTKGRRSRTLPIHGRLRKLFLTMDRSKGGLVFHAAQGGVLRPRNTLEIFINKVIEPLKDKFPTPAGEIGFEHGRLHSFRHYFCSQAFLGGASEGEIKEWLGHADSKMVEHYRHLRNEDAQRKMEQINFLDDSEGEVPASDVA